MSRFKSKMGETECTYCHKNINKEIKYINSSKKHNRPLFCDCTCSTSYYKDKGSYKNCGNVKISMQQIDWMNILHTDITMQKLYLVANAPYLLMILKPYGRNKKVYVPYLVYLCN